VQQLIRRASPPLPVTLLLLAMVAVQAGASIAKELFPLVGAIGMVTVRTAFGTLILCIVLRPWRARLSRRSLPPLLVYGISLGVMNLCYYLALARVPLGITVAIELIGPLAVAVLTSQRLSDFAWIVLAVAGLLLLLPLGHSGGDAIGMLLALGAGACWALYIVYGQRAGAHFGAQTVALGSVISALFILPLGWLTAGPALLRGAVLVPGVAVAVLSTALPYTLEMIALTRLPARTFGVLMSLEPAFGALIGYLRLHEHLTVLQWSAIALIICASIGTSVSARRSTQVPAIV
jgi:inner membrane transporter RhtA